MTCMCWLSKLLHLQENTSEDKKKPFNGKQKAEVASGDKTPKGKTILNGYNE